MGDFFVPKTGWERVLGTLLRRQPFEKSPPIFSNSVSNTKTKRFSAVSQPFPAKDTEKTLKRDSGGRTADLIEEKARFPGQMPGKQKGTNRLHLTKKDAGKEKLKGKYGQINI
uniref:Uncharacterized protein n=1 Tax=Trypanosoma vivax (strain Y486) TaxID=1055687 RepID=G0U0D2_TRYVY|nr:hypothetical protein, unlikely [Trypanosoma vivax Y486]